MDHVPTEHAEAAARAHTLRQQDAHDAEAVHHIPDGAVSDAALAITNLKSAYSGLAASARAFEQRGTHLQDKVDNVHCYHLEAAAVEVANMSSCRH